MRVDSVLKQFTYAVSFNSDANDLGGGNTIDFVGNDVDELAKEVIDDKPTFPMTFVPGSTAANGEEYPDAMGTFHETVAPGYVVAVMFKL